MADTYDIYPDTAGDGYDMYPDNAGETYDFYPDSTSYSIPGVEQDSYFASNPQRIEAEKLLIKKREELENENPPEAGNYECNFQEDNDNFAFTNPQILLRKKKEQKELLKKKKLEQQQKENELLYTSSETDSNFDSDTISFTNPLKRESIEKQTSDEESSDNTSDDEGFDDIATTELFIKELSIHQKPISLNNPSEPSPPNTSKKILGFFASTFNTIQEKVNDAYYSDNITIIRERTSDVVSPAIESAEGTGRAFWQRAKAGFGLAANSVSNGWKTVSEATVAAAEATVDTISNLSNKSTVNNNSTENAISPTPQMDLTHTNNLNQLDDIGMDNPLRKMALKKDKLKNEQVTKVQVV